MIRTINDNGRLKIERIRKEILKGKQEIPSEIRRLMGEVTDPTQAIIHSTTKLANYVENVKFYDGDNPPNPMGNLGSGPLFSPFNLFNW